MTLCILTLTTALLAPQAPDSSLAAPPQAETAIEIRHIPIREWLGTSAEIVDLPLGSFLGSPNDGGEPTALIVDPSEDRVLIGADSIIGLVHDFAPVDWGSGDLSMQLIDRSLQVAGPPADVQKVENTVRALTRSFVHNIAIRAELFRVRGEGDLPVTATPAELDQLTQNGRLQRVWSAQGMCAAGNVISLGKERITQYLHDVDVEVAQAAKIADPIVRSMFEGVRLTVEPHVLVDTRDVVLCAQFAFGEQRDTLGTRSLGNEQHPTLEVPRVDCTSGTMSARLADGTAMILSVQGDPIGGANMALAITGTRLDRGNEGPMEGVFPVSALLSRALRERVQNRDWETEDNAYPFHIRRMSEEIQILDSDTLYTMIEESAGLDDSEDKLRVMAGHVIIRGRPEARDGTLRLVRGLQNQTLRTAKVHAKTSLGNSRVDSRVFARGAVENSQGTLHDIAFPALLGRPHVLVRGHETTVIRDQDVEIAQKASISNPQVDRVFSGVFMSVLPYPMQTGVGADVVFDLLHAGDTRHLVAETRDGGDLYLPEANRARLSHAGPTPAGVELDLGEGPTVRKGDLSHETRQSVSVTLQ